MIRALWVFVGVLGLSGCVGQREVGDGGIGAGGEDSGVVTDASSDGGGMGRLGDVGRGQVDDGVVDGSGDGSSGLSDIALGDAAIADAPEVGGADNAIGDESSTPDATTVDVGSDGGSQLDTTPDGGPTPYTYDGPGYPTKLPATSPPDEWKSKGGLYQCEESIEIPSGADVPGPCVELLDFYGAGYANVVIAYGYDCDLRKRLTNSWYRSGPTDPFVPYFHTQYDWHEDGQPLREEWWGSKTHVIETWDYYPDGRLKSSYRLGEDLVDGSGSEKTYAFEYVIGESDLVLEQLTHYTQVLKYPIDAVDFDEWKLLEVNNYDEFQRLVKRARFNVSVKTGEKWPENAIEYTYDSKGRLEFEWTTTFPTEYMYGYRHTYVDLDGNEAHRIEFTKGVVGDLQPKEETISDAQGRVVLIRRDFDWDWPWFFDCPYGKCWGGNAQFMSTFVYDDQGHQTHELYWGGDFDYSEGQTPSLGISEYDEFGRPTASGQWLQKSEWDGGGFYINDFATIHYDCWDNGTAASADWIQ